jgi:hypothetical protein
MLEETGLIKEIEEDAKKTGVKTFELIFEPLPSGSGEHKIIGPVPKRLRILKCLEMWYKMQISSGCCGSNIAKDFNVAIVFSSLIRLKYKKKIPKGYAIDIFGDWQVVAYKICFKG